jgi:hypothetical protein
MGQEEMSETAKPSTAEVIIHSLYTHAYEQQQMLLVLHKSIVGMLGVLRDTVDGFDANFKLRMETLDAGEEFQSFEVHLDAMKQALQTISETLRIRPDDKQPSA